MNRVCPEVRVVRFRPSLELILPRVHQLSFQAQFPRQLVDVVAVLHPLDHLLHSRLDKHGWEFLLICVYLCPSVAKRA